MPPTAVDGLYLPGQIGSAKTAKDSKETSFRLDRHLHGNYPIAVSGKGNYLFTKDGRTIFDATTGAAVSCLGHGNERVIDAIRNQFGTGISYLASTFWGSDVVENLCKELVSGTDGKMARVYLTGSGVFVKGVYFVGKPYSIT
jgi:adenosylmethionine-8-amino-7-oxononanoate aminotransferase